MLAATTFKEGDFDAFRRFSKTVFDFISISVLRVCVGNNIEVRLFQTADFFIGLARNIYFPLIFLIKRKDLPWRAGEEVRFCGGNAMRRHCYDVERIGFEEVLFVFDHIQFHFFTRQCSPDKCQFALRCLSQRLSSEDEFFDLCIHTFIAHVLNVLLVVCPVADIFLNRYTLHQ